MLRTVGQRAAQCLRRVWPMLENIAKRSLHEGLLLHLDWLEEASSFIVDLLVCLLVSV